jgi:DnaJ-class molecular chaperone
MRLGKDVLEADLYGELGLLPDATAAELRVAYRRNARVSHPDLNHDPDAAARMARLNVAARVLLDPALRRAYDSLRRAPARKSRGSQPRAGRAAWFERRERSRDDGWVEPPTANVQAATSGRFGHFLAELRGHDGKLGLRIHELVQSLTTRQQIAVAALFVGIAMGLIAIARPYSLAGGEPGETQPCNVDASMLFP